jgi:hypothetical protein
MTTIDELERRVEALETAQKRTAETQDWMAATLGRMAFVQDEHTKTFKDHTTRLDRIEADVREVKADVKGLRADLPVMLADAVREGLKPSSD